MFGHREDYRVEEKRIEDNANRYQAKTYLSIEDFKQHIQNTISTISSSQLFTYICINILTLFYSGICSRRK